MKKKIGLILAISFLIPIAVFAKGQLYIDAGINKIYVDESYVGTGSKLLDLDSKNHHVVIKNKYDQEIRNELVSIRENEVTRIEIGKSDNPVNDIVPLTMHDNNLSQTSDITRPNTRINMAEFERSQQEKLAQRSQSIEPIRAKETKRLNLELSPYFLSRDYTNISNVNIGVCAGISYDFDWVTGAIHYINIKSEEQFGVDLRLKIYTNYLVGGVIFEKNDRKSYKLGVGVPILPFLNGEISAIRQDNNTGVLARVILVL